MQRKTLLYLFIAIVAFVALYLFYTDRERKQSIVKYFDQPQVGDIYKLKSDENGGRWLSYYKVAAVDSSQVLFYKSLMMADASSDILLNHFDTANTEIFSRHDLQQIKNGKWDTDGHGHTLLVEIVRRKKN